MKFKKKFVEYREAEVRTVKAGKGYHFAIPINDLEREMSRKDIFKRAHFFNDHGSVYAAFTTLYQVYENGEKFDFFVTKKAAIKRAKDYLK